MPVYIIHSNQQLNSLIPYLTADYLDNKGIHICKLQHGDINCSEHSRILQSGQHPMISLVYIPACLAQGIRIILNQLLEHFPNDDDNDEDDNDEDDNDEDDDNNNVDVDNMMVCPGCGLPFSEQ